MGDDGKPKQQPWEDWREGDDKNTSGWMRATSPSGAAAFEGQALWSGERGYGVRAAETGQAGEAEFRLARMAAAAKAAKALDASAGSGHNGGGRGGGHH